MQLVGAEISEDHGSLPLRIKIEELPTLTRSKLRSAYVFLVSDMFPLWRVVIYLLICLP